MGRMPSKFTRAYYSPHKRFTLSEWDHLQLYFCRQEAKDGSSTQSNDLKSLLAHCRFFDLQNTELSSDV